MNRLSLSTLLCAALAATTTANAAIVFDNYANASGFSDSVSGTTDVRWYAVYTANATNAPTLDLQQLRVRLFKPAGYTGGASIEAFVAIANGSNLATSYPTLAASGATTPVYASLGTVSLSSSGGTAVNSVASWGNGSSTLASVALNNSWSTRGCLFVGFRFTGQSTTSANRVGIRLSTGSTNGSATAPTTGAIDNAYWKSSGSVTGAITGPFIFSGSSTSYANVGCMDITGNLTPAPGALALLGVAGLVGARRRR